MKFYAFKHERKGNNYPHSDMYPWYDAFYERHVDVLDKADNQESDPYAWQRQIDELLTMEFEYPIQTRYEDPYGIEFDVPDEVGTMFLLRFKI